MTAEAKRGLPAIVPMLAYEDAGRACDWLVEAFGFVEQARVTMPDGTVGHAELRFGQGVITLATPSLDYESPKTHRAHCVEAAAWQRVPYVIDGVLVQVDDVEAHFEQAQASGATILSEIETEPYGRLYRAEDLEGHRWMFLEPANPDNSPEAEWVPPGAESVK